MCQCETFQKPYTPPPPPPVMLEIYRGKNSHITRTAASSTKTNSHERHTSVCRTNKLYSLTNSNIIIINSNSNDNNKTELNGKQSSTLSIYHRIKLITLIKRPPTLPPSPAILHLRARKRITKPSIYRLFNEAPFNRTRISFTLA